MTGIEQSNPHFDVRQPVRGRNILRLTIMSMMSASLIWLGRWLVPETTVLELKLAVIESWEAWSVMGFICIGCGFFGLLKACVFAVRSLSSSGEWHFRLTDDVLLWHVPRHAHGKEEGFEVALTDVTRIELRTIQKTEDIDENEYWIHFREAAPVQLKSYSGINLSGLVQKITAMGVPYEETVV